MLEIPPNGTYGVTLPGGRLIKAAVALHVRAYQALGGRGMGRSTILLTTVGARTGEERTVAIAGFPDGDGRWLVAGSAAGRAHHPAWFINLARNPDRVRIQVGAARFAATPALLRGEERAGAWQRIVAASSQFGGYETKTDREIPVVRLTRR